MTRFLRSGGQAAAGKKGELATMRSRLMRAGPVALLALLALPASAFATPDDLKQAVDGKLGGTVPVDTMWVIVAAVLVLFMQGGFAMLEIGFSRAKNAGTVVAKILTNLSIAALCYWAVGFALAFGNGALLGTDGFFLEGYGSARDAFGAMAFSDAAIESKWLFQFAFCAVALAIVWGTTLERIRYTAHAAFAVVFAALIYPIASHWVFGGGWLQTSVGTQDFAGSSAVHLTGATAGLAALLM